MSRQSWTYNENEICCMRYVERYVIGNSTMRLSEFVRTLKNELPRLSENSLKWKVQNIKYLSMKAGFNDSLKSAVAENCSQDNVRAFHAVLSMYNLV